MLQTVLHSGVIWLGISLTPEQTLDELPFGLWSLLVASLVFLHGSSEHIGRLIYWLVMQWALFRYLP